MAYEIGDTIQCRYFNTPEAKFYGPTWPATILDIQPGRTEQNGRLEKPYLVKRSDTGMQVWLQYKEIRWKI